MGWVLLVLAVAPLVAAFGAWLAPRRAAVAASVLAGTATFGLAASLVAVRGPVRALGGFFRVDALALVFLLAVSFLYALSTLFAAGYAVHRSPSQPMPAPETRRLFVGLNLFCWSMAMAPVVSNLALVWVAIEVTTVVSVLLVALDRTDEATEAAWKYLLVASLGLGIALFATMVLYAAGTAALGHVYELGYPRLVASATRLSRPAVRLAFVLAVLGFGTKMGLVPVHTWLPDAHSEAPTPVSALLSGSLLAVSFYAILRYDQIATLCTGPGFPHAVLLGFGLATLALGALLLLVQRDLKRFLAYSSIEHMGILAVGASLSSPLAAVGVLLHVLAHAAAKGTAFFGSGAVVAKYGTKDVRRVEGGMAALPFTGPMLLAALLGLAAMPPGAMFRSEYLIVSGGLDRAGRAEPAVAVVAVLVALVVLGSLGVVAVGSRTMLGTAPRGLSPGEPSVLIAVAMLVGLAGFYLLGIHPPAELNTLLHRAAGELGGRA
jgi:hydrogenase-4 component F